MKMSKWGVVAICCILLAIALWFTGKAATGLYSYYTLTEQAPIKKIDWSVYEKNSDIFYPIAHYHFAVDGKEYEGETILTEWPYRNAWAVEQGIKNYDTKYVWYSPKNPVKNSSLQKKFPFKESLYAAIVLLVYFYFIWVGYRMKKGI